jgi:16S rRNA (guanine527-N7)-methyltransferase
LSSSPPDPMSPVSRETGAWPPAPPPPTTAHPLFGARLSLVERYADLLAGPGVERGLLGPHEVERLWDRHLLNCGVLMPAIPAGTSVCDVGSGAGLPGLVIAIGRTDIQMTLLEPRLRAATFLTDVVDTLGLPHVTVVRARAEEHRGHKYDVVTARAVAPLDRLVRVAIGLCRSGGSLLAMKGERAAEELRGVEAELSARGVTRWSIEQFGAGYVSPPTTAVRLVVGRGSAGGGRRSAKSRTTDKRRRGPGSTGDGRR